MDPILVTGGTGTLGRPVVRRLRMAGHDVRVLTRGMPREDNGIRYVKGDLRSGEGVAAAVDGAATIIHCAGGHTGDEATTRELVTAAQRAGRPHLVFISVVGADRVHVHSLIDRALFSYFDMKRKAEQLVSGSGLPWTILRASQFHDLVFNVADAMTRLPIVPYPSGTPVQPVDVNDVAKRMVDLALALPAGFVPDLAGPRTYAFEDLLRSYMEATHRHRLLVPIRVPGRAARDAREGALISPHQADGTGTWEAFVAAHVGPPAHGSLRPTPTR